MNNSNCANQAQLAAATEAEASQKRGSTSSTPSISVSETTSNDKTKELTLLIKIHPHDILLGRGALAIRNPGNIRFGHIVSLRKVEYKNTSHRRTKDTIARQVIQAVRNSNGRFVRKLEGAHELERFQLKPNDHAWLEAEDEVILQKVKQSLRDKEPQQRPEPTFFKGPHAEITIKDEEACDKGRLLPETKQLAAKRRKVMLKIDSKATPAPNNTFGSYMSAPTPSITVDDAVHSFTLRNEATLDVARARITSDPTTTASSSNSTAGMDLLVETLIHKQQQEKREQEQQHRQQQQQLLFIGETTAANSTASNLASLQALLRQRLGGGGDDLAPAVSTSAAPQMSRFAISSTKGTAPSQLDQILAIERLRQDRDQRGGQPYHFHSLAAPNVGYNQQQQQQPHQQPVNVDALMNALRYRIGQARGPIQNVLQGATPLQSEMLLQYQQQQQQHHELSPLELELLRLRHGLTSSSNVPYAPPTPSQPQQLSTTETLLQ